MVDITQGGTTGHPTRRNVRNIYMVEQVVDWADALVAKGSALAAADIFDVLNVPAETVVLGGGVETLVAADSTTLTLNFGVTSADTITDGGDGKTVGYAPAGTNGTVALTNADRPVVADTATLALATLTGTLTTGSVRVYLVCLDVSGHNEK